MFKPSKKHSFDAHISVPQMSYYNPSLFDEFLEIDGFRYSDITYLFHQDRLDKRINSVDLDNYVKGLRERLPQNVFCGMSDTEICELIQSRRITNFADLRSQALDMSNRAEELKQYKQQRDDYKKSQDEQKKKLEELVKGSFSTPDKE